MVLEAKRSRLLGVVMAVRTRAEVEEILARRIAEDRGFRARLLADPRAVLGAVLGITVPEIVTVTIHTESLTDVHLTIPADVDQLSEADLELAAGGLDWGDSTFSGRNPKCVG